MRVPTHPTLILRMRDARLKLLRSAGPVLAASLVRIAKHCGRPNCHCQHGEKHIGNYLTYKVQRKTRTLYVPLDQLEEVRQWVEEQRRVRQLLREISQLNLALLHSRKLRRRASPRTS